MRRSLFIAREQTRVCPSYSMYATQSRQTKFSHKTFFSLATTAGDRSKRTTTPVLTAKRSFTARNTGELPIEIYGFYINGLPCEGYGFKVLDCEAFRLAPNATKMIEIAFTPDFTLSRVERKLLVLTSVGPDSSDVENGVVMFNLLATLPAYSLDSCGSVLSRPWWERVGQWLAVGLSPVLFVCVLVVSFIEADRILRESLTSYSKESPVQPPLDLRLLSHISTGHATSQVGGSAATRSEKAGGGPSDERSKTRTTKDDTFPDWSLMNVKKCKDKDTQKGLKIPDWSADEERRFKLDTESKDLLSFKRCEEPSNADSTAVSVSSTAATYGTKRRNNKKLSNIHEAQSDNCTTNDTLADAQLVPEKKCTHSAVARSSPTSSRRGKTTTMMTTTQSSIKEESKLIDHEMDMAIMTNNNRAAKSDNKRKQANSTGNNSNPSNSVALKKLEPTGTQRVIHLSEEETSSTTTESSTHDETTSCKVSISIIRMYVCIYVCVLTRTVVPLVAEILVGSVAKVSGIYTPRVE